MVSARPLPSAPSQSVGVGELRMDRSAFVTNPPNPNLALNQFVHPDPLGGPPVFDAVSWFDAARTNVSWNNVSWNSVSWNDAEFSPVSWSSVSWSSAAWATVSWNDVSWNDVSWNDVSWNDLSYEDAAEGDANSTDGYDLTQEQLDQIMSDPEMAPDPEAVPDGLGNGG
jgi:hypothetical protein